MAKKIMVVDDEKDNRETIKSVLKKEGYEVVEAVNADEALEKLDKKKVDLILLDIMMPGTPVRKAVPKMDAKIIFVTVVRTSEAEKEDLLSMDKVVDFVEKPYDVDELVKKVKKHA